MTVSAPAVSVVIATYNWSSVLRCAIRSVLAQTMEDFELLVVGDACNDDSAEVVAAFADPRIRWFNLGRNTGHQSGPNNEGIARSRGEFIAYLGHDDLWYPTHLEYLLRAIRDTGSDLAFSEIVLIGPEGSSTRNLWDRAAIEAVRHIPPSALMHRRDLTGRIGPWGDYRRLEESPDVDLVRRAVAHRCRFVAVPELTVFKFPAVWRRDCYRERSSAQQEQYLRRMLTDSAFLDEERTAIRDARARGDIHAPAGTEIAPPPPGTVAGWNVRQARRLRGLPEEAGTETVQPLAPAAERRT